MMMKIWHMFTPSHLMKKIIGDFDCRAILDDKGDLYIWPELNCYHNDVRKGLNVGRLASLMLTNPDKDYGHAKVGVKGFDSEPTSYSDEKVLRILHSNRGLIELYGEDFDVDTFDWG